jgi:Na+/pantothenate symporter
VQLLISWAELALAAAPSGTAAALPTILRAVALCDRFQLVALRVRAALLLVRVFVEAGSLRKAVAELATVTPQALEHSTTPVR